MELITPISEEQINLLRVGDMIEISGHIICGRDAVLPKIVALIKEDRADELKVDLRGQVVFHTAVSAAGVGPTSSNKLEIESTIAPLSQHGVRIHLGKGRIGEDTIRLLNDYNSAYAIIPPITALLGVRTTDVKVLAFPELGMEALHMIKVEKYPAIIGAIHGRSIYG